MVAKEKKESVVTLFIFSIVVVLILANLYYIGTLGGLFDGGMGTELAPYEISTCEQLQDIASYLSSDFILTTNIDCSNTSNPDSPLWNGGLGFEPIGTQGAPFAGNLRGNGKTVSGLYINRPDADFVGLFGVTSKGVTIQDVGVIADVTGRNHVGAIAGLSGAVITRVFVEGTVTGNDTVGGLVGENLFEIFDFYSDALVVGNRHVGGIAGINSGDYVDVLACQVSVYDCLLDGAISNGYFTGSVSPSIQQDRVALGIGGIVGRNRAIPQSYYPDGSSPSDTGRIATARVSDVFSTSDLHGINGVLIRLPSGNTFWRNGSFEGVTGGTAELVTASASQPFGSWDFDSVWTVEDDAPFLAVFATAPEDPSPEEPSDTPRGGRSSSRTTTDDILPEETTEDIPPPPRPPATTQPPQETRDEEPAPPQPPAEDTPAPITQDGFNYWWWLLAALLIGGLLIGAAAVVVTKKQTYSLEYVDQLEHRLEVMLQTMSEAQIEQKLLALGWPKEVIEFEMRIAKKLIILGNQAAVLEQYIRTSLETMSPESVRALLVSRGWDAEVVDYKIRNINRVK